MSDVAALIADMVRQGVDPDLIGRTAAALSERAPVLVQDTAAERSRAKAAERQARYRERNNDVTVTSRNVAGDATKEIPPTPPKENNPTPKENPPKGGQKKRASRLSADWVLPDDWRADAIKAGLPENLIDRESEKMRDWSLSSPNGAKRDWRASWRNWVKGAVDKMPRGSPHGNETNSDRARRLLKENGNGHQRNTDIGSNDTGVRYISPPTSVAG